MESEPQRPSGAEARPDHEESRLIHRTASFALLLNLVLAAAKGALAVHTGSLALTASAVDSGTDVVASLVLVGGLRLSTLKSERFPLGLYKIENVLSVVVALFIFLAGYEIAREALSAPAPPRHVSVGVVAVQAAATLAVVLFGRYALSAGRRTGSPTLVAEGRHRQVDALSSLIVLVSLTLENLGLHWRPLGLGVDQIAAALVLVFIALAGWELLADGMRVLLDASIDAETLDEIRAIVRRDPMVDEIKGLVGRNAGRFRFINLRIAVRATDLEKAHAVGERIEARIRERISHVEGVTIHYAPRRATHRRVAVALADGAGAVGERFGESPVFAVVAVRTADGRIGERRMLDNPYLDMGKGKGIRVAEWLVGEKVDEVWVREDIGHKGPGYVFADAGLRVVRTGAAHLDAVLAKVSGRYGAAGPEAGPSDA